MLRELRDAGGQIEVTIRSPGESRRDLLDAFARCRSGDCGCPTDVHERIDDLDVRSWPDRLIVRVRPRDGEDLPLDDVQRCVDWTIQRTRHG